MDKQNISPLVAVAREYFLRADAARPDVLELFTPDVEIYFPKFGVRRGHEAFAELARGIGSSVQRLSHDMDRLTFKAVGDTVFVEGVTRGALHSGAQWEGGTTAGGRFCSVFDFQRAKISRMYIYLDPDYVAADSGRIEWHHEGRLHW
jgi:hypothetical protein